MDEKETLQIGKGKPGPGRPKGLLNKNTTLLKDAILLAAQNAGGGEDGLVAYLQAQAIANPGPFLALLGKVLPLQIVGKDGGALQLEVTQVTDTEAARMMAFTLYKGELALARERRDH
jgi:hypothetical protein